MAKEIERKFLVHGSPWQEAGVTGVLFIQGYLSQSPVVRVRLEGNVGKLTVKNATSLVTCDEYEYEIPAKEAKELLETVAEKPLIEKTRYTLNHKENTWEIDVFAGENAGLVVAEIELASEEEIFEKPSWLGTEVSHDSRYKNVNLIRHPYSAW